MACLDFFSMPVDLSFYRRLGGMGGVGGVGPAHRNSEHKLSKLGRLLASS